MLIYKRLKDNIHYFYFSYITSDEFDNYIKTFDNIFREECKFKIVFDLCDLHIHDTLYAVQKIKFMRENLLNTQIYIEKTAIIITDKLVLSLLNRWILSIYKPVKPNIITDDINEALHFLYNNK